MSAPILRRVSTCYYRGGQPVIPVTGEAHFSRIARAQWPLVAGQLASLGVTMAASYVFWNHHQPNSDAPPDFSGNLDLAAWIDVLHAVGLEAMIRIGPWVHGEARYGGLPDWIACGPTRTNDPDYLAAVRRWFTALARHLRSGGLGPLAAIQIENELYDQPEHLDTLKQIARQAGFETEIWTATGWGGAQFDRAEFLPVYGGYPDTFWSSHSIGWESRCAIHYHFQPVRDDVLIGADGRLSEAAPPVDDTDLPYATCELGAGMASAYHRRPMVAAEDVGALGICKIGCGSVWQGWYMMAGGFNPLPGGAAVNESTATGYPNDLPVRDYDFQAPIGAAGQLRRSAHFLRHQHSMLALLGHGLAGSTIVFGEADSRLRHSIRSWGSTALVLFNNHQPHTKMPAVQDVSLQLPGHRAVPPRPVTVAPGEFGAWIAGLELADGMTVVSSDVMPVARLDWSDGPVWVFAQTLADSAMLVLETPAGEQILERGPVGELPDLVSITEQGAAGLSVLIVGQEHLPHLWIIDSECYLSGAPLLRYRREMVAQCDPGSLLTPVYRLRPGGFELHQVLPTLTANQLPHQVIESDQQHVVRVDLPPDRGEFDRLMICWHGNVARVVPAGAPNIDANLIADQFWRPGTELAVPATQLPTGCTAVDVYITPFAAGEVLTCGQFSDCAVSAVRWDPVLLYPVEGCDV